MTVIDAALKVWIDVHSDMRCREGDRRPRRRIVADVLCAWERHGQAMRYLNNKGRVAWKPSPMMLDHWKDQEADAESDWRHDD
ncbi:MAG: hypothetical protein K2Y71_15755 [Xanthobacteraceae bacterium]|nr:hypothetical protein [Xanthobacteraceae bacterium]